MAQLDLRFARLSNEGSGPLPADRDWILGEAFAFYIGDDEKLAEVNGGRIVSLGEVGRIILGPSTSILVQGRPLTPPDRTAIALDQDIFIAGRDRVRVLVHAPNQPNARVPLALHAAGRDFAAGEVALDGNGLGQWSCRDLPAGAYEVRVLEARAVFQVAQERLLPFSARILERAFAAGDGRAVLRLRLALECFGLPFVGAVDLALFDQGSRQRLTELAGREASAEGILEVELPLVGEGPFALQLEARGDRARSAWLPLPGPQPEDRAAVVLSNWGEERLLRAGPFEGARELRGVFLGARKGSRSKAPFRIDEVAGPRLRLRTRSEIDHWKALVLAEGGGKPRAFEGGALAAGEAVELELHGAYALVLLGAISFGNCWEGRALFVLPSAIEVGLEAPARAEPGRAIEVGLSGPPGASVYVLVKDERLTSPASSIEAAAAVALRRAVARCLDAHPESEWVRRPLAPLLEELGAVGGLADPFSARAGDELFEPQRPPRRPPSNPALRSAEAEAPRPEVLTAPLRRASRYEALLAAKTHAELEVPLLEDEGGPIIRFDAEESMVGLLLDPRGDGREAADREAARGALPEVLEARIIALDAQGKGRFSVTLGDAVSSYALSAFYAHGAHEASARARVVATRDLFGALDLPRFVRRGDFVEGRLHVRVAEGESAVTLRRDGEPVALARGRERAERLAVAAPGATLRFAAPPGAYEARVVGRAGEALAHGRVERPGRGSWTQRRLLFLAPGEGIDREALAGATLRLLPSLDAAFERLVAGLLALPPGSCEQTAAGLLAAASAYLTAPDEKAERAAIEHIAAGARRMARMHIPGAGFRGWPEGPQEVFDYSPGATWNLLELGVFEDVPVERELKAAIDSLLAMARDAAKAHGIAAAPAKPSSPRQAYARFKQVPEERDRMVAYILEHIETLENGAEAITQFTPPDVRGEAAYHFSPSMVRAQTAYGAALLIEARGEALTRGLHLANTVLAGIRRSGTLYGTIDSIAALALLSACRRAGFGITAPETRLLIDDREATLEQALAAEEISRVRAHDAVLLIEVQKVVEENATELESAIPPSARLLRARDGHPHEIYELGEAIDLEVRLNGPTEPGDLIHVYLPDALSFMFGSGQTKHLAIDLEGREELRIPLAATALTRGAEGGLGTQRFFVILRNSYDELRGHALGNLELIVRPPHRG